ncbi:CaiB/BaiF CoA transferase family protein [Marinobacterium rhizophilum]|uniref:CoA transferase n=1 Tax=Marinobacterium rhizophilum TaxID=420402 RepID=A0ABY5HJX0_9GAMM|nr:CaiB/BaiF CoA-transferase family protein [Marinobacterium rhizophilum]UTW12414.1 CoA transferase [Marinobacterium rhizophilum]
MGPLAGFKIIEIAGIGPGPFCGMMLADMGAEVIRIERAGDRLVDGGKRPVTLRGRRSLALDLKSEQGRSLLLKMCESADALFEGYRPGVMERLGLGPDICLARNSRLIYGRMTGWGQDGPLAQTAGHDINYIALSGALQAIGRAGEAPLPPLNLVGDFGGGAMFLAFGLVCALLEAQRSGQGQVVDSAMVDGSSLLMAMFHDFKHRGAFDETRGSHFLSGAAHYYDCYQTADGEHIAIGALEPQFYWLLIDKAGLDEALFADQGFGNPKADPARFPQLKAALAAVFRQKTRDQWCELLEGTDACFAPVLSISEAPQHPHNRARQSFVELEGVLQPAPAPRFSRTRPDVGASTRTPSEAGDSLLRHWGLSERDIAMFQDMNNNSQTAR